MGQSKFDDNKYNQWGRKYPAVVSLTFPLLAIIYVFYDKIAGDGLSEFLAVFKIILFFGTIVPALFFFYMMSIREISISVLENFLNWLFGKPTSNLFLPNFKMISNPMKESIKKTLKDEYHIDLNEAKLFENGKEANRRNRVYRHRVNEAVSCMRDVVRGNSILLEFNAIYGFFRNLAGGMLLNLILIVILFLIGLNSGVVDYNNELTWSFYIIGTLFIICLLFSITSRYRYARRLFYLFDQHKQEKGGA